MGMLNDAYNRVLAYTTRRDPPSYTTPPARPADRVHGGTNTDSSISNIRDYVSIGPARTAPTSGPRSDTVPSPSGQRTGHAPSPGGSSPQYDQAGQFRTDVDALPYGLLPTGGRDDARPGSSIALKPDPYVSGKREGQ